MALQLQFKKIPHIPYGTKPLIIHI
jgi:hypothetical protein